MAFLTGLKGFIGICDINRTGSSIYIFIFIRKYFELNPIMEDSDVNPLVSKGDGAGGGRETDSLTIKQGRKRCQGM